METTTRTDKPATDIGPSIAAARAKKEKEIEGDEDVGPDPDGYDEAPLADREITVDMLKKWDDDHFQTRAMVNRALAGRPRPGEWALLVHDGGDQAKRWCARFATVAGVGNKALVRRNAILSHTTALQAPFSESEIVHEAAKFLADINLKEDYLTASAAYRLGRAVRKNSNAVAVVLVESIGRAPNQGPRWTVFSVEPLPTAPAEDSDPPPRAA